MRKMNNLSDFVITKAGKLKKYKGSEENVIVPENIVEIGSRAFYFSEIESIKLPQGLRIIGSEAFCGCCGLQSIIIPESVEKIEFDAIPASLKYVRIPDRLIKELGMPGVKRVFGITDLSRLQSMLLNDMDSLGGLLKKRIIDSINREYTDLIESAIRFNVVVKLENLLSFKKVIAVEDIDEMITYANNYKDSSIETLAYLIDYKDKHFSKDYIEKQKIEQEQKSLGITERTVADWRKIFKISIKDRKTTIKGYKCNDENLVIPDKIGNNEVVGIEARAFTGCSVIKNIVLPHSLKFIGDAAFEMCTNRDTLIVDEGNSKYHSNGNCLIDTDRKVLVMGCNSSCIPANGSVTTIGVCAFEYCMNIEEIIIPDSVTVIGKGAFCNCRKLKKITLSQNIETIEKSVFSCCKELAELNLPESVTEIQANAFSWCSKLKKIKIGEKVTVIGENAFWNCSAVTIHTPAGSYAETYAKENNIPFVTIEQSGDEQSGDGSVVEP